jgi:hypothetical protein
MPGVGNLFSTAGRIGYSHLCRGPQKKKVIMSWAVSETISLTQKVQLVFSWKRKIRLAVFLHRTEFAVLTSRIHKA